MKHRRSALAIGLVLSACAHAPTPPRELFFDDFSYAARAELAGGGWTVRDGVGHPGVPGGRWSADGVTLVDDTTQRGNRLLRLTARTDGSAPGTEQAQLCHQRKVLEGTYAARVRFSDTPVRGGDGDPVIQTFFAVSPLKHDFDPEFSEIDWEYLPNGGWGSDKTRLYGITWQTVRVEPWQAHNAAHEAFGSHAGWHTLVMQVHAGRTHWFVDGRKVAEHGGRNHPVVPMAIAFSHWFSPTGLLAPTSAPRVYEMDVDWVLHARGAVLAPAQVADAVQALRQRGTARVDTVPSAQPPLESRCDF